MRFCNISPDSYTYPILIQACAIRFSELGGRTIHGHVWKMGFDSDIYVRNTLIKMYVNCGSMEYARQVFDECPVLDSVSWNSILAGYIQVEDLEAAKELYDLMPKRDIFTANSMISLFGKLGHVTEARQLFDEMRERDKVSWSALISCYEQNELYQEALSLFKKMVASGVPMDEVVLLSSIS
ncbi:hypothetical protein SOVF_206330, partial [Spinacia oleracea]